MRWPKLTLRTSMLLVAICAINGAVIRFWIVRPDYRSVIATGLLLALNTILMVTLRRWLRRSAKGVSSIFRDVFLVVGWIALMLSAAVVIAEAGGTLGEGIINLVRGPAIYFTEWAFPSLMSDARRSPHIRVLLGAALAIYLNVVVSGPLLLFAAFAGWAAAAFGRRRDQRETQVAGEA